MRKLGISIYPMHNSREEIKDYISLAGKYGFKRIFTCLLSVEGEKERILDEFKDIVTHANSFGMEVIADVSPKVFKDLELDIKDLRFFKDMGLYGIRLDMGFNGIEESQMTYNPYGMKIEVNMSNGTKYIDNILSYLPNKENLLGCHNFYPHRYTGLSFEHFIKCSEQFKEKGLRTAAFVSSNTAKYGPWPVSEGLCTLECHRNLPIDVQAKHLWATDLIDDVIIANAFASEEELKALSELDPYCLELKCTLVENIPAIEGDIVSKEYHFNRGDVSEYVIRSTQSRVKYRNEYFEPLNIREIKKGDVLIESSLYKRYSGELQIALKDMKNSGKTSVVGRISEEEIYLLDYIRPWQKFKFEES